MKQIFGLNDYGRGGVGCQKNRFRLTEIFQKIPTADWIVLTVPVRANNPNEKDAKSGRPPTSMTLSAHLSEGDEDKKSEKIIDIRLIVASAIHTLPLLIFLLFITLVIIIMSLIVQFYYNLKNSVYIMSW